MRNYRTYKETQYVMPTADLLLVTFVVLKLTGVIDWSWWWVLSPIWIMGAITGLIFVGAFIYVSVKKAIRRHKKRK